MAKWVLRGEVADLIDGTKSHKKVSLALRKRKNRKELGLILEETQFKPTRH